MTTATNAWRFTSTTVPTLIRGDVTVSDRTGRVSHSKLGKVADDVWALRTRYPQANPGDVTVTVVSEEDLFDLDAMMHGAYVGGETKKFTADISVNERSFTDRSPNPNGMPVALTVPNWRYVLTHEYGHAFTARRDERKVIKTWREYGGDLSGYGQTSPFEGYAEAFAEWYLSVGRTDNEAALAYARVFGWRIP